MGSGSGAAYVYLQSQDGMSTELIAKLVPSDLKSGDQFGSSVATSGQGIVVVSAPLKAQEEKKLINAGAVYVYLVGAVGTTPQLMSKLSGRAQEDRFGTSVSISPDGLLVVGAPYDDTPSGTDVGSASLYRVASDGTTALFASLSAGNTDEKFGCSVAAGLDGLVVIGAEHNSATATRAGAVYVYNVDPLTGDYILATTIYSPTNTAFGYFGSSVATGGADRLIVVGAPGEDSDSGAAHIYFKPLGLNIVEVATLHASDPAGSDFFGSSVAIGGQALVVVGAHGNDDNGSLTGSAYLYDASVANAPQVKKLVPQDAASNDNFGWSVAVNDGRDPVVVVGAWGDDSRKGSVYAYSPVLTSV